MHIYQRDMWVRFSLIQDYICKESYTARLLCSWVILDESQHRSKKQYNELQYYESENLSNEYKGWNKENKETPRDLRMTKIKLSFNKDLGAHYKNISIINSPKTTILITKYLHIQENLVS